jgi:predicted small lipoprotein YifL
MLDKIWLNARKIGILARQLINQKLLNRKKMKKVFFVFAVAVGVAMTACNNKGPEGETPKNDTAATTAVTTATKDSTSTTTSSTDSAGVKKDTTAPTTTKTEKKVEKKTK